MIVYRQAHWVFLHRRLDGGASVGSLDLCPDGEILYASGLVVNDRFSVAVKIESQSGRRIILLRVEYIALQLTILLNLVLKGRGTDKLALLRVVVAEGIIDFLTRCPGTVFFRRIILVRPGYQGFPDFLTQRCSRRSPGACTTPNCR